MFFSKSSQGAHKPNLIQWKQVLKLLTQVLYVIKSTDTATRNSCKKAL